MEVEAERARGVFPIELPRIRTFRLDLADAMKPATVVAKPRFQPTHLVHFDFLCEVDSQLLEQCKHFDGINLSSGRCKVAAVAAAARFRPADLDAFVGLPSGLTVTAQSPTTEDHLLHTAPILSSGDWQMEAKSFLAAMPFLSHRQPEAANAFQQPCQPIVTVQPSPLVIKLSVPSPHFIAWCNWNAAYLSAVYLGALPPREAPVISKVLPMTVPVPSTESSLWSFCVGCSDPCAAASG